MRKTVSVLLLLALLISLASCGGEYSAYTVACELAESYGGFGTVYAECVAEGDDGYVDGDFFKTLYMTDPDPETDYAIFLSGGLDKPCEFGIFIAKDASSYLAVRELISKRLDMLSAVGYLENSQVLRHGYTVFYSTLPDTERAERLFRSIVGGA